MKTLAESYPVIFALFADAGLNKPSVIQHLGAGELNNSYLVYVGHASYCVRIAKDKERNGLRREADALSRIPENIGPKIVYAAPHANIESYISGKTPLRLTLKQFESLGRKLAAFHRIEAPGHDVVDEGEVTRVTSDVWKTLVFNCRNIYNEHHLLHDLPEKRLEKIMRRAKVFFDKQSNGATKKRLLHKDVTHSNMLVNGDEVFLIDWEFRGFGDPMLDFTTGFWDDIEFNNGKWRIMLDAYERAALFGGYKKAGGVINEVSMKNWLACDMLGAAAFLCLRLHNRPGDTSDAVFEQYRIDFENILNSLDRKLKNA